jgi:hypothetical protein
MAVGGLELVNRISSMVSRTASDSQHPFDLVYYEMTWELTEWKEVPREAILKVPNPTGGPVICHSTLYEIWCFIPDNEY